MNWQKLWINDVLAQIPPGGYRRRLEAELRDHLETQCRALMESGRAPDAAQAEALRAMGEPERLKAEYLAAWRRSPRGRAGWIASHLGAIAGGCVLMGTLYILTAGLLGWIGFTYDAVFLEPHTLTGQNFPILAGGWNLFVYSCALFLIPFPLGALFLRFCFRRERRPVELVTAGLLAAWVGEKAAIISISMLIYYPMPLGPALLIRIYDGGDTTAPWLSPTYYLLTFIGCLLLGQLIGQIPGRTNRRALA